jgi:hypothetical protein
VGLVGDVGDRAADGEVGDLLEADTETESETDSTFLKIPADGLGEAAGGPAA